MLSKYFKSTLTSPPFPILHFSPFNFDIGRIDVLCFDYCCIILKQPSGLEMPDFNLKITKKTSLKNHISLQVLWYFCLFQLISVRFLPPL